MMSDPTSDELIPDNLIVVTFPDAAAIDRGVNALKMMRGGSVKLYASAVVARDESGRLSVEEITKRGHGGTTVGALIGGLAGLPLGPLAMTIGAAGGALIGISADLLNNGDDDAFALKISRELDLGSAVIVADVAEDGLVPFEALMKAAGGTVVRK